MIDYSELCELIVRQQQKQLPLKAVSAESVGNHLKFNMDIIWTILKVIIFTAILTVIAKQAYNFIFLIGKKPMIWVLFMLLLNFLFFLIGSTIQDSFNAVWWSSALLFFALLPPKKNKEDKEAIIDVADEMYKEKWGFKLYLCYCFFVFVCFKNIARQFNLWLL